MKKNRLVPTFSAQDIRQEIVSDSELRQVWYKISDVERILIFFVSAECLTKEDNLYILRRLW